MWYFFLSLYSLFFFALAWKNFRYAAMLFIVGLPAYLIRFKIGPLPSTLLELNFGILFLVWLIKYAKHDWPNLKSKIPNHKLFLVFCSLFLLASIGGIFISDMWYYSLGQWRAYFLEPMLAFVMLVGRLTSSPAGESPLERRVVAHGDRNVLSPYYKLSNDVTHPRAPLSRGDLSLPDLILALLFSTIPISLFGIAQYFTGWHIGNVDWVALQTHRITSLFLSPNAVALYLVPVTLVGFLAFVKTESARTKYLATILVLLNLITIALSRSLGGAAALAVGVLVFLFLRGYKKITIVSILVGSLLLLTPYSQHLLSTKSQSSANRLALWSYTQTFLTASPKNFVFGAGIRQFFRKIQKPYYDTKKMERLIYPHNIFLNFWSEIGLFGMLAFIGIYTSLSLIAYRAYSTHKILAASLVASLVVLLIHGFIDVPYFKNDLAMLFWIIAAIGVSAY